MPEACGTDLEECSVALLLEGLGKAVQHAAVLDGLARVSVQILRPRPARHLQPAMPPCHRQEHDSSIGINTCSAYRC